MIYSIKSFLQINKDSTNKHFIICCLFNIFNVANYCMCSRKILSIKRNIKKFTDFSSRAGWARKIMRFIKKAFREKMMRFLADQWVICFIFAWFEGGFAGLWVVLLVCGQFCWFVSGLAGLWVVLSFTANGSYAPLSVFMISKKFQIYVKLLFLLVLHHNI